MRQPPRTWICYGEPVSARDSRVVRYERYRGAVAYIAVVDAAGSQQIGSGFHVGDGVFVTARHVVEGRRISKIATTQRSYEPIDLPKLEELAREWPDMNLLSEYGERAEMGELGIGISEPSAGKVVDGPLFHPDSTIDVAALVVDGIEAPAIPLGDHLDDWLGNEFTLAEAIVLGFPRIPFAKEPLLVATRAEVNAVVDKYTGGHPHFILSSIARGGFSGGVAIVGEIALGLVTESLVADGGPPESGYFAVLSVEPIYNCLAEHGVLPHAVRKAWADNDDGISIWDVPRDRVEDWASGRFQDAGWRGRASRRLGGSHAAAE